MKYLLISITVLISGCACCNESVQLPNDIKTHDRYLPYPEIRIDGRTLPLTMIYDGFYTAYGKLKDSTTGKTIEVNAVVKTKDSTGNKLKEPTLDLSLYVPKDSLKTTDSTITKETIKKVKSTFLEYLEEFKWIILSIALVIVLMIIYRIKK